MKIIRLTEGDITGFWKNYWENIPRDPDRISDKTIYPLYPVDEYVNPGICVLETGCGMGRVFKHYYHEGIEIYGMDFDVGSLKKIKQENSRFPLIAADARRLPFRDECLDMVMAFGLVSSIEVGHLQALSEMARVLKKGGILCASVVSETALRRCQDFLSLVKHTINRITNRPSSRHFFARSYQPSEWALELENLGFDVFRIEPTHSRVLFWQYLPFLRQNGIEMDPTMARDADRGYKLRPAGEKLFCLLRHHAPWLISIGVVGLGKKR
jgi:SAM-dependent methyltransferase